MAATKTKIWTLEEVHSLPDDGNKYELVRGELFVTPPPTDYHETISARLTRLLDPFVAANGLGLVNHPRAVMRFEGSEVEPDLMVRQAHPKPEKDWTARRLPASSWRSSPTARAGGTTIRKRAYIRCRRRVLDRRLRASHGDCRSGGRTGPRRA